MKVDLGRLSDGRLTTRHSIDGQDPLLEGLPGRVVAPVAVEIRVSSVGGEAFVAELTVEGTAETRCRRCLDPVRVSLDDRYRVVLQVADDAREDPGDDDIVLIDGVTSEVDFAPLVRERLLIESERYPVCDESCRGICPECGRNRNKHVCDCVEDRVDDRWSALIGVKFDNG